MAAGDARSGAAGHSGPGAGAAAHGVAAAGVERHGYAGAGAEGDGAAAAAASRLRLVKAAELSGATAQTSGMVRAAAISGELVGAQSLWMSRTVLTAGASSGDHHHGESETGIFVVSGSPAFVFRDPASGEVVRLEPEPGDYVWVPPHVPHREENR